MNISSSMRNYGIKVLAVLILFALTILLSNMISQYEVSGYELLTNGGFDNELDSWRKAGDVTVVSSDSQKVVRLKSENNKPNK